MPDMKTLTVGGVTYNIVDETARNGLANIPTTVEDALEEAKSSGAFKGDTGAAGPQGPKGDKGDTGATGATGPQGPQGPKGDTGAAGPQGPKGDKGDTGADGKSPEISITTGQETDGRTRVTIEVTEYIGEIENKQSAVITDGVKGDKGDKGDTGLTGAKGDTGATGATGPQGPQGPKGDDGKDGLDATPVTPLFANSVAECTDTSKFYVLPDGFIYAYMLTEKTVPTYTNKLRTAQVSPADTSVYETNGYLTEGRIGSSGSVSTGVSGMCCTGYIPVSKGNIIRLKNVTPSGSKSAYVLFYGSGGNLWTAATLYGEDLTPDSNGVYTITVTQDNTAFVRFSFGVIDSTSIITVNEEITEGSTTVVKEYAWTNTGHAFVPADYEGRILELEEQTAAHTADIAELRDAIENIGTDVDADQITLIKNWNAPIYDDAPVFLLSNEKPAMGDSTVAAIYAKYDALMAAHPGYITKTDLGLASDGTTHIYRYDFCEPRTRKNPENNNHPDLDKPKAIIVSGIHLEYAGIYALYYALEEIANNSELHHDLRNNTHLIVVPAMNPFCLESANYTAANGRKNANGVEIHRNFEVDHVVIDASSNNYGGAVPLSEVESQYVDAIMAENPDAAFFLTCHNYDYDTYFGTGFIWPSVATNYMYNMGSRLIDKMSKAWLDKYGDTFRNGVDAVKTDSVATGDYTVGMVGMSGSPGTETKQALKYGIHGANVEIAKLFKVMEPSATTAGSSQVMSRGAEVYVNFLRMAFGCYDRKDKTLYSK